MESTNIVDIMASGDQKGWYEALKRGVEFSSTTDLQLMEVLQYPGDESPRWSERSLDDMTIQGLFDEV